MLKRTSYLSNNSDISRLETEDVVVKLIENGEPDTKKELPTKMLDAILSSVLLCCADKGDTSTMRKYALQYPQALLELLQPIVPISKVGNQDLKAELMQQRNIAPLENWEFKTESPISEASKEILVDDRTPIKLYKMAGKVGYFTVNSYSNYDAHVLYCFGDSSYSLVDNTVIVDEDCIHRISQIVPGCVQIYFEFANGAITLYVEQISQGFSEELDDKLELKHSALQDEIVSECLEICGACGISYFAKVEVNDVSDGVWTLHIGAPQTITGSEYNDSQVIKHRIESVVQTYIQELFKNNVVFV